MPWEEGSEGSVMTEEGGGVEDDLCNGWMMR
jgi:hypothetical protein